VIGRRRLITREERQITWRRRRRTIPLMLLTTAMAFVGAPAAMVMLVVADRLRGRPQYPSARMYLVVLQYLCNDTVEIIAAPLLWVAAGFGTRLHSAWSIALHEGIQRWSLRTLHHRAAQLLGVRLVVDGGDELEPGPVIVLSHHVHAADAALPAFLYLVQRRWHVRGVIMAELLADPGFDLIYQRTGHCFINRAAPDFARVQVRQVASPLDERTAVVIFPEGRLYGPALRDHSLTRVAQRDPERARRLGALRHVLPPRPHGVVDLLNAAPRADVVLLAHTGLESMPSMRDIFRRGLPPAIPVHIQARRVPREQIPVNPDRQLEWLDNTWKQLDDAIDDMLHARSVAFS
jgi:1-acyl-sn-glycerol-3-phosphate acyltransferase